ncbi:MAG: hypothetical protein KDA65_10880 [Planctomycetaceae bacterium]|nr:hypothetical protein [Planctomycetaceae bacterium]
MNDSRNRSFRLYLLVLFLLGVGNLWLAWMWNTARDSALDAQQQYRKVEQIAEQIRLLRETPIQVQEEEKTAAAIVQQVETASRKNGLKQEQLISITPTKPSRIADTPYQKQETEVDLREVSLKQAIGFTVALTEPGVDFQISEISFSLPPSSNSTEIKSTQEFWNVNLLLTSHLYDPKIPAP